MNLVGTDINHPESSLVTKKGLEAWSGARAAEARAAELWRKGGATSMLAELREEANRQLCTSIFSQSAGPFVPPT